MTIAMTTLFDRTAAVGQQRLIHNNGAGIRVGRGKVQSLRVGIAVGVRGRHLNIGVDAVFLDFENEVAIVSAGNDDVAVGACPLPACGKVVQIGVVVRPRYEVSGGIIRVHGKMRTRIGIVVRAEGNGNRVEILVVLIHCCHRRDHRAVVMHGNVDVPIGVVVGIVLHRNVDGAVKNVACADEFIAPVILPRRKVVGVVHGPLAGGRIIHGSRHLHGDAVHDQLSIAGRRNLLPALLKSQGNGLRALILAVRQRNVAAFSLEVHGEGTFARGRVGGVVRMLGIALARNQRFIHGNGVGIRVGILERNDGLRIARHGHGEGGA